MRTQKERVACLDLQRKLSDLEKLSSVKGALPQGSLKKVKR
jgi:hypothetical protein